ncbi:MAG: DUF2231 domain-containing protein [Acidimicrobiales bacterium]
MRPVLTIKGRKFKGLRGWAGKPLHPPLTDIPIGAYILVAGLDLISFLGRHSAWSKEFYQAASFGLVGGATVSVLAAGTGFWDRWRSSEAGTQARRTVNTHALIMVTVTVIVLVNLALRWFHYHSNPHAPPVILVLSLLAAGLVGIGSTFGGSLVFDYGFNVETAGDHPVWHHSEVDVFPGRPHPVTAETSGGRDAKSGLDEPLA